MRIFTAFRALYFATLTLLTGSGLLSTYLGLRLAHSMVYLTYNNVFHRLSCYGLSNVTLVVLWARLGWKLFV